MYAFLIYSSTLDADQHHSYSYGYGTNFFRIVGDRPFGRGDVVEILEHGQRAANEYRIKVRVLGDPRVSGRRFDEKTRIELPTLLFLSSRVYLSEYSDYQMVTATNAEILTYQSIKQDHNKIYAVAMLVTGNEARVLCAEPTTKVRWEWVITSKDDLREVA